MTGVRVLEWLFAAIALWLAWSTAMELWIAWYSGAESDVSPGRWWLGVARLVVFLLAAVLVVATEFAAAEG